MRSDFPLNKKMKLKYCSSTLFVLYCTWYSILICKILHYPGINTTEYIIKYKSGRFLVNY